MGDSWRPGLEGDGPSGPPDDPALIDEWLRVPEPQPPLSRRWERAAYLVVGLAVLANGAALVFHIVRGIELSSLLLVFWMAGLLAIATVLIRTHPAHRMLLVRPFVVGIGAGLAATVAYDISKALLSQLDPAPWNPFEATRVFGSLLVGSDAPDALVRFAGWSFHLSNGMTFGIAFTFLFGRRAMAGLPWAIGLGAAWGLFLETFQLVLYPGWLNIRFVDEFRQVSFLAHLVFGATLGPLVWAGLRRINWEG